MEELQVYAFKYQRAESVTSAAAALSADDAAKVLSGGDDFVAVDEAPLDRAHRAD